MRLLLAAGVALCLGYVPYRVCGPQGLSKIDQLRRDLTTLNQQNQKLARTNNELRRKIYLLQHDSLLVEQIARDAYAYVKPTDLVFDFVAQ